MKGRGGIESRDLNRKEKKNTKESGILYGPKTGFNYEYEIKDSGQRREFSTGAVRDMSEGKGRFDLLPMFALTDLAIHYEKGCKKYGDRNWEQGIPISKFTDSALRHLAQFVMGLEDEGHLISAIWNLMCAKDTLDRIELGILPKELDDLPYPLKKQKRE